MLEELLGKYESTLHDLAAQAHDGEDVNDLVKQTVNKAIEHFGSLDNGNTDDLKAKLQNALNIGSNLVPDDKPEYKKALDYASSLLDK